jgi:hypothetical protein
VSLTGTLPEMSIDESLADVTPLISRVGLVGGNNIPHPGEI